MQLPHSAKFLLSRSKTRLHRGEYGLGAQAVHLQHWIGTRHASLKIQLEGTSPYVATFLMLRSECCISLGLDGKI